MAKKNRFSAKHDSAFPFEHEQDASTGSFGVFDNERKVFVSHTTEKAAKREVKRLNGKGGK